MSNWLRYAAFTHRPDGGNPAGIVLDASGMDAVRMQAAAAEIGDSETAFLTAAGTGRYRVRYFSPKIEIPFCGHATIASAIALFQQKNEHSLIFETAVGEVPVTVREDADGPIATLTSVAPRVDDATPELVAGALAALRWSEHELDSGMPPRIAFAGARHLVLAAAMRARLADLDYDFDALAAIMRAHELTTIDLVWRETQILFHARNPFPVGGVVEDPATGGAAAAFGGYLRAMGLVRTPATIEIHQGDDMGRPSRLRVAIGERGGIRVGGGAVRIANSPNRVDGSIGDRTNDLTDDRFRIAPSDRSAEDRRS